MSEHRRNPGAGRQQDGLLTAQVGSLRPIERHQAMRLLLLVSSLILEGAVGFTLPEFLPTVAVPIFEAAKDTPGMSSAFGMTPIHHPTLAVYSRAAGGQWLPMMSIASAQSLLESYITVLSAHPLETKVGTACLLAIVGDGLAQQRGSTAFTYDVKRGVSFVMFDALYRGAFQHAAFPWIIELCAGKAVLSAMPSLTPSLAAAIECTAFNQLCVVPIVYYPLFFAITGIVQGLSLKDSFERAQEQFVPLMLRNWLFWIPAQFVQFNFLPIEWQVPYTCAMGLAWNVILSAIAGSAASQNTDLQSSSLAPEAVEVVITPRDSVARSSTSSKAGASGSGSAR